MSEERASLHTLAHNQNLKISQIESEIEKVSDFNEKLKENLKKANTMRNNSEEEVRKLNFQN